MTPTPSSSAGPSAATPPVDWPDAARRAAFERWLGTLGSHGIDAATLRPASADASFRRYLRVDAAGGPSLIVMDAPPPQEDVRPFVDLAGRLERADLAAPRVLAHDAEHGFVLLTDLGERSCLAALQHAAAAGDAKAVNASMNDAFATLIDWQRRIDPAGLPPYDDALLRRELALFPDWCVERERGLRWNADELAVWQGACDQLVASALAQPRVAVHRDYMPRNLMVTPDGPAILDFQDAVAGPIAYDPASMLRDAFISWDEEQEIDWAVRYWERARKEGLPVDADFGEFWRQLEWIGLQRHLKVLGIFCRLKHRDAKPAYAADLPRFFGYARRVASRYRIFGPLQLLLDAVEGHESVVGYTF